MAGKDNPDDDLYGEPTQYANYSDGGATGGSGGRAYSEVPDPTGFQPSADYGYDTGYQTGYGQAPAPEPPTPWFRKPAALVFLGALAALILALAIYAIVQLAGGSSSTTDTTTTTTPSAELATTTAEAPAPGETQTATEAPPPPPVTETVTETPTTEAPVETTTETTEPPTETVTETQTVTSTPTRNWPTLPTIFPRPGDGG